MSDKCECPARKMLAGLPTKISASAGHIWIGGAAVREDERNAALADPCPCDQLRKETEAAKTEAAARLKQYLTQVEIHTRNTKEWRVALDAAESDRDQLRAENAGLRTAVRKSRESGCWCDEHGHPCAGCGFRQQRDDFRAETVALRRQVAEHQEWLAHDSQYAENQRLEAANADLRKQARESAYKVAQMRGIVDAAEKLLCGLYEHILPLSVHTREVMRDLRNALGDEQVDSSQDQPTVRGDAKAK